MASTNSTVEESETGPLPIAEIIVVLGLFFILCVGKSLKVRVQYFSMQVLINKCFVLKPCKKIWR